MLILFFIIIFIAELIVTLWIISGIRKADTYVCTLNSKIIEDKKIIKSELSQLREHLKGVLSSLDCFVTFLSDKREKCKHLIKKNLLTSLAALILKIPAKKIITIINLGLTIKKFFK